MHCCGYLFGYTKPQGLPLNEAVQHQRPLDTALFFIFCALYRTFCFAAAGNPSGITPSMSRPCQRPFPADETADAIDFHTCFPSGGLAANFSRKDKERGQALSLLKIFSLLKKIRAPSKKPANFFLSEPVVSTRGLWGANRVRALVQKSAENWYRRSGRL